MSTKMIRILLADSHKMLREGLRILIDGEEDLAVIGEAADSGEALALVQDLNPTVAILDFALPGIGGLATIRNIRQSRPGCKILVCAMQGDQAQLTQAFKAGADGFVHKTNAHNHLLDAVRAVAAGERYIDPASTIILVE